MKKLIIAVLLVVGMTSMAQNGNGKPQRAENEKLSPEQRNQMHLKRMTSDLNLNAKQQEQVGHLFAEHSEKRDALKAKRDANRMNQERPSDEERIAHRNQMLEEKKAFDTKMKSILSPEQYEKWNALKEKNREKRDCKMREKKN